MTLAAVLFDLDGTLVDTLPICYLAFRGALERAGAPTLTDAEIHALFGPSVRTVVVKESHGHLRAESLHPAVACERIRQAASEAVRERSSITPFRVAGPIQLVLDVLALVVRAEVSALREHRLHPERGPPKRAQVVLEALAGGVEDVLGANEDQTSG